MRLENLGETKIAELKVILKADFRGSIEAIRKELEKLHHEEVRVRILHAGHRRHHRKRRATGPDFAAKTRSSSASTSCPTIGACAWPRSAASRSANTTSFTS